MRLTDGSTLYRARKYPTGMLSGCTAETAVEVSNSPWLLDAEDCAFDLDDDGWTDVDGDCDDADAMVYPGPSDIPLDGIDKIAMGGCCPRVHGCHRNQFYIDATVNDGSCTYLAFRWTFQEEGGGWDFMACGWRDVCVDANFENASSVMPTNAAWETAQFSLVPSWGRMHIGLFDPMGWPKWMLEF